MNIRKIEKSEWYQELKSDIEAELQNLNKQAYDAKPAMEAEKNRLANQLQGWLTSLGNSDLAPSLRTDLEKKYEEAFQRIQDIDVIIENLVSEQKVHQHVVDSTQILRRLENLSEVFNSKNASRLHLELSLHIDKIDCYPDKKIVMRTSRLGALADVIPFLSTGSLPKAKEEGNKKNDGKVVPRRRARLNTGGDSSNGDLASLANWAADPNRFGGLDDHWFDEIEFHVPTETAWYQIRAAEVFHRRQETKYSYGKLSEEYEVTKPTIRAAVKYYLETHPDAVDNVVLQCGGKRPPKFNLATFGDEARDLWEAGWSKLKLAEKFGCSSPTIDKAMEWSYAKDGMSLPTKEQREILTTARARTLLDEGNALNEISEKMSISDVTVRRYLKKSFEAEGKTMPDLRSGNNSAK